MEIKQIFSATRKCDNCTLSDRTISLTNQYNITFSRYRYLAYRNFVSWCWGFLGRKIRVVIPSCVVQRVRRQFPDSQGQYVGFRLPPLDWSETHSWRSPPPSLDVRTQNTGPEGCGFSEGHPCMLLGLQRLAPWWSPSILPHILCNIWQSQTMM